MRKSFEVKVPLTPNNIEVNGKFTPIEEFTDEELRQIAKEWGEILVQKARRKLLPAK